MYRAIKLVICLGSAAVIGSAVGMMELHHLIHGSMAFPILALCCAAYVAGIVSVYCLLEDSK